MRARNPKTDVHWREAGSEQQPNSPAPNLPTKKPISVFPSVCEGSWGICFTQLTVAFPQTPNHGRSTWLRCLGLMGAVGRQRSWSAQCLYGQGGEMRAAMLALTDGFHHPVMVKSKQLVDMPQGPVLHPLPGFMVALMAITTSGAGSCWSCWSLDNNCPWTRPLE